MADLNFDPLIWTSAMERFLGALSPPTSPTEQALAWARLGLPVALVAEHFTQAHETVEAAIDAHNRGDERALEQAIEGIVVACLSGGAIAARLHLGATA